MGHRVEAEVVGFNDETLFLLPFTEPQGIGPGAKVRVLSHTSQVCLGPDLLGRIIDGRGQPLDGKPPPECRDVLSLQGRPINPMERGPIKEVLDVGVKAINGMLTIGRGQRLGLVAGSGVGKSVLLGMMTRFTEADVVVIGLIGERGREVQAFIEESLGPVGLAKSVLVAAPANESPKSQPGMDSPFLSHHPIYPPGLPTLKEILESKSPSTDKSASLPAPT
jgi:flagellum-specific ATP synthase